MAIKLCVVLFLFVCNAFCKTFVHENDTLELSSDDYAPFNVTQVDDGRDVIYSNGEDGEELLSFKPQQNYMANLCKQKRVLHDRNAILVSLSANNRVPTINPCVFGVESASFPTYMFVVTFRSMKLSTKSNNVCVKTRLDLFDGQSFSHQISDSSGLCGTSTHHSSYETSRNFLTMRFGYISQAVNVHENFQAVITPFHLVIGGPYGLLLRFPTL
ncbi:hypothetical protein MAR_025734 [Mya arenaria]|uniref:Uncharacterized protein n=1 Tax=Mya arenaria TaxID=6604 RepID=A0ABY7ET17_MYAAR|nr:hypothetical protein MAR_025734 [Mya arenaria]